MAQPPVTSGHPAPFLGAELYDMTEDERRRELTKRALEAEEKAKKRRRGFLADGADSAGYDF